MVLIGCDNTEKRDFISMAKSFSLMTSAVVYLWDNVNNSGCENLV